MTTHSSRIGKIMAFSLVTALAALQADAQFSFGYGGRGRGRPSVGVFVGPGGGVGVNYGRGGYGTYGSGPYSRSRVGVYVAPRPYSYAPRVIVETPPATVASQPGTNPNTIQPPPPPTLSTTPTATAPQNAYLVQAQSDFRAGDYVKAERYANHAAIESENGHAYLFLSQCQLALGKYLESANSIRHAMAVLPQPEWGTVVKNFKKYYRNADYVRQIQGLEAFVKKNPSASYSYFLLGYHYGYLDYKKESLTVLNKAASVDGNDAMTAALIRSFGGKPPTVDVPRPAPSGILDEE